MCSTEGTGEHGGCSSLPLLMHVHSAFALMKRQSQLLSDGSVLPAGCSARCDSGAAARHPEPPSPRLLLGGFINYVLRVWFSAA